MRIEKRKFFGHSREFVTYESVEEYLRTGRDKEDLVRWEYLPRYQTRGTEVQEVSKRLEDLRVMEKMLVTSDGEVIPIIGVKRQVNRKHVLTAVFLDTAFGRFELKYGFKCDRWTGKQVQYCHQALVDNIVGANDFWMGFSLSYPTAWKRLNQDPFAAIRWMKTQHILKREFFERLRSCMTNDGYIKIVEQLLPTAEAKTAITHCITQNDDLAIKSKSSLGVLNLALEFTKIMKEPGSKSLPGETAKELSPTGQVDENRPMPFVPVAAKRGGGK